MPRLDPTVDVGLGNDDWVDPVDRWFSTGEGWDDLTEEEQARVNAVLGLSEAVLLEHPGNHDQKVHGRRGKAGPPYGTPLEPFANEGRGPELSSTGAVERLVHPGDMGDQESKDFVAMTLGDELAKHPDRLRDIATAGALGAIVDQGSGYAAERAERDHFAKRSVLLEDTAALRRRIRYNSSDEDIEGIHAQIAAKEKELADLSALYQRHDYRLSRGLELWDSLSGSERLELLNGESGQYVRYAIAAGVVSQWAQTSSDAHPHAIATQFAAAEEFGLEMMVGNDRAFFRRGGQPQAQKAVAQTYIERLNTEASDAYRANGSALRAIVRTNYEYTQKQFAKAGIKTVRVARGVSALPPGVGPLDQPGQHATVTARQNPLSSWSTSHTVARDFGSVVLMTEVPVSRVYSTSMTGPGCRNEWEVVLLGGEYNVTVVRS